MGGATRDVGILFLEECSKTLTNGSCPGHHNHVVIIEVDADENEKDNGIQEITQGNVER